MTIEEFDLELENSENILADFWAPWCGPCKMLGPIINQIEEENPLLKVIKINVDESMELASKYGIRSIPTMMIFKSKEGSATKTGALPKVKVQEWVDENIVKS